MEKLKMYFLKPKVFTKDTNVYTNTTEYYILRGG